MKNIKRLIVVRHGNTFRAGEVPTRVGAHTDLPLVEEKRGLSAGQYLLSLGIHPDIVYAAPLKRTTQTAELIIKAMNSSCKVIPKGDFTEIDYGPDENQTEDTVELRLGINSLKKAGDYSPDLSKDILMQEGKRILELWNTQALAPESWRVNIPELTAAWKKLADSITWGESVIVVSSNGILRFAPTILENYTEFCETHDIKVATGGVGIFEMTEPMTHWECHIWNEKPYKLF